ncbi:MAG: hypothetical protein LBG57_01610 [Treponema sp.]|jgi:hypothetical protein|nr:hypothetical protein [Treponema sp.]
MAKKKKAIYAPGELDRIRKKLNVSDAEAKRMTGILGGEVGVERSETPDSGRKGRSRRETVELVVGRSGRDRKPGRHVEIAGEDEESGGMKKERAKENDPADDPSVQLRISYSERVKMDRYAAQADFDIKNSGQLLVSVLSFFKEPVDYVNPRFVTRRMNDYYGKIEQMVTSTRTLFPRNNLKRNERMKRISPFVFAVLNTFRNWNIEQITAGLAKLQASPRTVKVSDFTEILKLIYRPLFILEQLNMEEHIKSAFKLLYKVLYLDNPKEAQEKFQDLIRTALASFTYVRRNVHYCLYPMLMKLISDRWLPYERFFIDRRRRYMAFLGVSDQNQISADGINARQIESGDTDALKEDLQKEQAEAESAETAEEDPNDPEVIARNARKAAKEAERKALGKGLAALEVLFPKAGWEDLSSYPDLYPYFVTPYSLRKGYELIAPTDPLQQIAVLMHILEDLFIAVRNISFGVVSGSDGNPIQLERYLGDIIINWRGYIEDSFMKEYLPRLADHCRILENSSEARNSVFAKKTLNELHWIKRLYFLPYYKFESLGPPPFQKQDVIPIYSTVRTLRKYLLAIAAGIEMATRYQGGANAGAHCEGIDNPWESYDFEIPNPVSRRLDMLLSPGKRNNASLIFFSLSATAVLDHLINDEDSWAYGDRPGPLFRSVNGEGTIPMFGVDKKIDADQIFKDELKKKKG